MTQIKFSRVISVSSEDPKHPANNLLKPEISGCWKCKEAGENQAVIILQLEKPCVIENVTIGNENSAFIEILVGKSAVPDSFEVLRVTSTLMTVQESKNEKNKHAVRFFKQEEFTKSVSEKSWDRIKIICSQPFNKSTQYGLSFVKIHSKTSSDEKNNENFASALGKFTLKEDEKDDIQLSIGSFFAKRNEAPESDQISAAAAIRAANNNPSSMIKPKRLSDVLLDIKDSKRKHKNDDSNLNPSMDYRRTTTGPLLYTGNLSDEVKIGSSAKKPFQTDSHSTDGTPRIDKKKRTANVNASQKVSPKKPKPKINNVDVISEERKVFKKKPFSRLLEDVVFVLSGFENPLRANLRSKAMEMGAKYKANWDKLCTHLICAFTNTPKFNQVKGKGWIVKKNWIEDCYQLRKRLLSKSYILDKKDTFTKSEEEIWEETAEDTNSNSKSSQQMNNSTLQQIDDTDVSQAVASSQGSNISSQDDIYDVDTDVDSDYSNSVPEVSNYEHWTFEILPEFFENIKFYLGTDLLTSIVDMLKRYIIAYKGDILDDIDNVNYIISGDSRYKENVSNIPVILPDWIWECNDQKALIPADNYLLK